MAEGFSYSFDIIYGGLEISKLQFLSKNILKNFSCKTFPIFGNETLDPDPDWYSA